MHSSQDLFYKISANFREDPGLFFVRLLSTMIVPYLRMKKGVHIGPGFTLKGIPVLEVFGTGSIEIQRNVTLYSTWRQYFAHFTSPVRLFVEDNSKINIGSNTRINGATIHARKKIVVGNNCLIAANTTIIDSNGHDLCLEYPDERILSVDSPEEIIIEDSVWIGINCVILKGVRIGYGSVIGAGSVVTKDIPPQTVAAGNPAIVLKKTLST